MPSSVRGRSLLQSDALRLAAAWQELRPHWHGWLASAIAHAAMLLVAYLFVGKGQPAPTPETDRTIGIVLAPRRSAGPSTGTAPANSAAVAQAPASPSLSERISRHAPAIAPGDLLPEAAPAIGAGGASGGAATASGMAHGSQGIGAFGNDGPPTEVFGITAAGNRFAYVFDRSGSMGGPGGNLLQAAKAELLRSLDRLSDLQQFQIIFYNDQPTVMQLAAQPGRLVLASEENKASARDFLARITAVGATRHEEAISAALRMRPDVIFFLTDADEPAMSKDQLARIRRLNGDRTRIHAIEFGHGPKVGGADNFIVRLSSQNGGQYRYIDVTRELGN